MASLDSKKVERALLQKGFQQDGGNKDHKYFRFYHEGKDTGIFTKTSHNSQDIGDGLVSAMSKQLSMEKTFFTSFVNCKKTESDYQKVLIGKGRLE